MKFESPLIEGTLAKRYKRFFADVHLANGSTVTAHCPNTGSMKTCADEGASVFLLEHPIHLKRKLRYTWEYTKGHDGLIGINTARPNQIVSEAILQGLVTEVTGYPELKREVKLGDSRMDILLSRGSEKCWIEIKNVTLLHDGQPCFPDAVTERGKKHIRHLADAVKRGERAIMFYLVNRSEGTRLTFAEHIDPEYVALLRAAKKNGVEILAYRTKPSLQGIELGESVGTELTH